MEKWRRNEILQESREEIAKLSAEIDKLYDRCLEVCGTDDKAGWLGDYLFHDGSLEKLESYLSASTFTFSEEVLRFGGRDIIWVEDCKEGRLGFYRSTGRNSGMAGEWLPFEGIGLHPFWGSLWFDKSRFCDEAPMIRYGNKRLRDISKTLTSLPIPEGEVKNPWEINIFIGSEASLLWNKSVDFSKYDYKKWLN